MKADKYRVHGILAVIGCCLLYGAVSGLGANCKGIFYSVVADALGVSLTKVTLYCTFYGIAGALTIPFCTRLYNRHAAKIILSVMIFVYAGAQFLMGYVQNVYQLYILGTIQGIPGGFLMLYPLQHIIGNWYPDKKGTLMGLAAMSSGVLGMIFNPIASSWITAFGWRTAYRMLSSLVCAVGLAATLFMLYKTPEEKGLTARESKRAAVGRSGRRDAGPVTLALYLVFLLLIDLVVSFPQILPSFAGSIGKTAAFGATMVSAAMFGNVLFKLIVGWLNDRIGARLATIVASCPIMAGALAMSMITDGPVLIGAAFCGGSVLSIYALEFPLLFRELCSPKQFEKYYKYTCSLNSILGSFSVAALAFGYNATGSYRPVMLACAAAMAAVIVICVYFEVLARRQRADR